MVNWLKRFLKKFTYEEDLGTAYNKYRVSRGWDRAVANATLTMIAQRQADDMAAWGRVSHTSADGQSFKQRLAVNGLVNIMAGENVAAGQLTGEEVILAWDDDPPHRSVMANPLLNRIGVGKASRGDGYFYWCLVLAKFD